ncbi:AAA family ATPase [uncultured Sphaerochaeta sp.]|uniref:chromosome segregation SMC family protein n=1 Tax=uncultured Sphaerochaeta sp. TaxID=886478 RepID=UPI002A0A3C29|nr:AAA family ATPase [uncultured Sphaerochaeta sp.]
MFLKSLEIFGFKSFADKVNLEFSDGITSLLGPNGCGKSNIVDAIKWVLGEQSTKTLRAGRMEDVIFNGTDTRKPLQVAEVTLTINNENGTLPLDSPEIEIKRRIFRTGESEYQINRNRVLLKNIRELFFDTGVGKSAYSILEQGKIDQILSSRPEDRRYIFEEAAGISRFKQQSLEAERKLERTDENIVQVENILKEVRRNYETKKNQAVKATSYRELKKEQFSLEVDIQLSTVKSYLMLRESKQEQKIKAEQDYETQKGSLSSCDIEIEEMQTQMRETGSKRIAIQTELQRLDEAQKGRNDKLDLLTQRFRDFCRQKDEAGARSEAILERIQRDTDEMDEKLNAMADIDEALEELTAEIEKNLKGLESTKALIKSQDEEIGQTETTDIGIDEELEGLSNKLKALTDVIVVEIEEKLKKSGYNLEEKKLALDDFLAKLSHIEASVSEHTGFLEKLKATGVAANEVILQQQRYQSVLSKALGELKELFASYQIHQASFIDELIAPEGIISEKHSLEAAMGAKRKLLSGNRDRISYLREENRKLSDALESYQMAITDQKVALNQLQGQKQGAKDWVAKLKLSITEQEYQHKDALSNSENAQERIYETQEDIRDTEAELKEMKSKVSELNEDLKDIITLIEEKGELIRSRQDFKASSYERLQALRSEGEKLGFQVEQLALNISGIYTSFFENFGKSLKEFESRLDEEINDIPVLKTRLEEVKRKIDGLGYINQMAEDEFAEVKEQYDFLTKQLDDLTKAKNDLNAVVMEIKTRSEQLFLATYKQISDNFQEMFRRLFGGGRAELKLVDMENVLTSGIDILAQPPGKKLTHLSLLSGGERSMTAVALLFATYLVKPSPFCILDEIDAALDDRNIGYFLSVLEDFAMKSQFIIITHNKHTVMGSRTLLGVTQMEAGVSTTVSYRIGRIEGEPVIYNDDSTEVSFNAEGSVLGTP